MAILAKLVLASSDAAPIARNHPPPFDLHCAELEARIRAEADFNLLSAEEFEEVKLDIRTFTSGRSDDIELVRSIGRLGTIKQYPHLRDRCMLEPCSAVRVGKTRVLTAMHCVQARGNALPTSQFVARTAFVQFGFLSPSNAGIRVRLKPIPSETDKGFDFALLEFEGRPPSEEDVPIVRLSRQSPELGEIDPKVPGSSPQFKIIGYPGGGYAYTKQGCYSVETYRDGWIRHTCLLKGGYSGAPVFLNDELVAIISHYPADYRETNQVPKGLAGAVGPAIDRNPEWVRHVRTGTANIRVPGVMSVESGAPRDIPKNNLARTLTHFQIGQYLSDARTAYGRAARTEWRDGNAHVLSLETTLERRPFQVTHTYENSTLRSVRIAFTAATESRGDNKAECDEA